MGIWGAVVHGCHAMELSIAAPSGNTERWRVHYLRADVSSESKEKMVLVHGVASTGASWPPGVLVSLSKRYDVYCITPPGAGHEATPPSLERATVEEAFDMYTQVIKQFVLAVGTDAVVVAHSMGAYLSLRAALRYPALINKLVVMSMPGCLPWLGANGALWAVYFRGRNLWPWAAALDGLVSKCVHFGYLFGTSHWRWPLLPAVLDAGTKTKIAVMTGEFDTIAPVSQGAIIGDLLRVPFHQVAGGSHDITAQHIPFLDSLNNAILGAAVPRPAPPSVLAEVNQIVQRGAGVSSFNVKESARHIAELEARLRSLSG